VDFEWDEAKNQANIRKHGFDFSDAWKVFETPLLETIDTRTYYGEERLSGIGLLGNRIVVVIFSQRSKDTIRIISVPKALKHERKKFEETIRDRLGSHRPNDG
jgi:uncharacterized DUF497 family protein